MCKKCGCNTCESIRGPLLTEGRVKKLVSENLQYHINENIPLMESVFRIGSDAHLSIIKEARKLYSRGVLDLCEEDEGIMETHLLLVIDVLKQKIELQPVTGHVDYLDMLHN
jgi:hypothetical protein